MSFALLSWQEVRERMLFSEQYDRMLCGCTACHAACYKKMRCERAVLTLLAVHRCKRWEMGKLGQLNYATIQQIALYLSRTWEEDCWL